MRFFGFGKLTLDEAFESYGKIVDYCENRTKRGKPCLKPVGLQQITFKLLDKPVHQTVQNALKIPRRIDGGRSGRVQEELELALDRKSTRRNSSHLRIP